MSLQPCRECGREISSEAPTCPFCGVPREKIETKTPKSSNVGCLTVVGIGIAIILFASIGNRDNSSSTSGGNAVIADLRGKKAECQENVRQLVELGATKITDHDDYSVAEYYDWNWSAFDHDDKIRQALLIFCAKMPPDGHYSVLIRDRKSGKQLGSVVDGNYWD